MQARRALLPLLALLLAGGAAVLARNWLEEQRQTSMVAHRPEAPSLAVLVAASELHTGQFLQLDLVRWQDWPNVAVPDTYLVRGRAQQDEVAGAVAREDIAVGQPIARGRIVKPGDRGFLAAVLEPG